MPISQRAQTRIAWLLLLAVLLGVGWLLGAVLMPFLLALTVAYALHPAVERMARWRIPRLVGASVALVLLAVALVALGSLIVSVLDTTVPQLQQQVPGLLGKLTDWLGAVAARMGMQTHLDLATLGSALTRSISGDPQRWALQVLSSARTGGSTLLNLLGNAVLVPVLTLYLLLDWRELMQRATGLVPLRHQERLGALLEECDEVLGRYLRGQLTVMLVLAAFYAVGLSLAGFQLAVPIGVFTGLAVAVPFIGFGIGLVLALLAGALQFQSWYALGAVAVVYGLGQVLESSYLTPRLLGRRIGLHPLFVIFLLLAFGDLFGFVGVLLALPAGALMLVVARHLVHWYRASSLYLQ
ncbi:AI-2E family transporter [Thiomonas sp.]|uniref:AI-2E family transporter n=1 Tax=Thiomonas sp. TaxID=2047785 RepID=UPI002606D68C|nr:AI-2E family transporter [Thiomonas sp.]